MTTLTLYAALLAPIAAALIGFGRRALVPALALLFLMLFFGWPVLAYDHTCIDQPNPSTECLQKSIQDAHKNNAVLSNYTASNNKEVYRQLRLHIDYINPLLRRMLEAENTIKDLQKRVVSLEVKLRNSGSAASSPPPIAEDSAGATASIESDEASAALGLPPRGLPQYDANVENKGGWYLGTFDKAAKIYAATESIENSPAYSYQSRIDYLCNPSTEGDPVNECTFYILQCKYETDQFGSESTVQIRLPKTPVGGGVYWLEIFKISGQWIGRDYNPANRPSEDHSIAVGGLNPLTDCKVISDGVFTATIMTDPIPKVDPSTLLRSLLYR